MACSTTSERLPDWERRLSQYLRDEGRSTFEWGQNDCALFAAGAAAAQTGIDLAAAFRGAYDTREGSALALRDLGKGTLIKTMSAYFEPCRPAFARRGDLVMAQNAIGICMGGFGLFLSLDGYERIPRADFTHAWRV